MCVCVCVCVCVFVKSIFIPPSKRSFRGVYCFQPVRDSVILSFRQHFDNILTSLLNNLSSFARCSSNFQHTCTVRQHMCDMNLGAKGSVLQELWDFLNLYIECLP